MLQINTVAVLGAGIIGAQISAIFADAGYQVLLFDLPSGGTDPNSLVKESIKGIFDISEQTLHNCANINNIIPANYDDDLEKIQNCQIIIESISEQRKWKEALYLRIIPYLHLDAILVTNTAGLSINQLASCLPINIQKKFIGIHFFNPPKFMKLVELITNYNTDKKILIEVEKFLIEKLSRKVIYAKDTCYFIGNRINTFTLISSIYHAHRLDITPDVVDLISGELIFRSQQPVFKLIDSLGIDNFSNTINLMKQSLLNDPWNKCFEVPHWMHKLLEKGMLGNKVKSGIYRTIDNEYQVIDLKLGTYRNVNTKLSPQINKIFNSNKSCNDIVLELSSSKNPEAVFLWSIIADLWHYCFYHCQYIAHSYKDIDRAVEYGFNWKLGPFELLKKCNLDKIQIKLNDSIQKGELLSNYPEKVDVKSFN